MNKLILKLWNSVYPYKYMDDWKNSLKHYYMNKKTFAPTLT